jgi:hypothetical protein
VAPLVLAVGVMLVAASIMILFFHYRPLLVGEVPKQAKLAA